MPRSLSGQSIIGGSDRVAEPQSRSVPTFSRCRPSTTAFRKCVVPIITPSTAAAGSPAASSTARIAAPTPEVTSAVVEDFTVASTSVPRRSAASVLVPPTSTPMRSIRYPFFLPPRSVPRLSAVVLVPKTL